MLSFGGEAPALTGVRMDARVSSRAQLQTTTERRYNCTSLLPKQTVSYGLARTAERRRQRNILRRVHSLINVLRDEFIQCLWQVTAIPKIVAFVCHVRFEVARETMCVSSVDVPCDVCTRECALWQDAW